MALPNASFKVRAPPEFISLVRAFVSVCQDESHRNIKGSRRMDIELYMGVVERRSSLAANATCWKIGRVD